MLERLGLSFECWVRKHLPDPFVLVLLLTFVTLALCIVHDPSAAALAILPKAWFDGFWKLLSFAMQMVLIVVTGEAIVATKPAARLIRALAELPKSRDQALWLLSTVALTLGWLHWGFGLIGAALLARRMAESLEERKIQVDYPLLGTAAYLSMLLWHAGTTASAPLLINTPKHFLEPQIGLIPLRETIFLPVNLGVCALLLLITPWIIVRMHPRAAIRSIHDYPAAAQPTPRAETPARTPAEKWDRHPLIGRLAGGGGLLTLGWIWTQAGFDLTHNTVNFLLLSLGLLIHGAPISYARAISHSLRGTSGIVLQFPFYGGIMGLMDDSHLGQAIGGAFVRFATPRTLPFFAYLASVFTKLFVPSGGGEWAVEGPVMLIAAKGLGAPIGKTTMGVAYGNMVGNLFQPFWAIPLLSILGLGARDIMGYCLVVFLFAFPILGAALLIP